MAYVLRGFCIVVWVDWVVEMGDEMDESVGGRGLRSWMLSVSSHDCD